MSDQLKSKRVRQMTILDILALITGIAGGVNALNAGKTVAEYHYVIRWVAGVALGFSCFWLMKLGIKSAIKCLNEGGPKYNRMHLISAGLLFVAAIGLVIGSEFIVTRTLKLVFAAH